MLFSMQVMRDYVRGDFSQDTSDGFISDDQIDRWLNEGYMYYTHKLMLAYEGYFEQTFSLSIVAGVETIAMPTLFDGRGKSTKSMRLERLTANAKIPLQFNRRYTEANYTGGMSGYTYCPNWDLRGNNIVLEPTPGLSESASTVSGLLLTAQVMPARLRASTAQAGATATVTLDVGADPRNSYYNGCRVYIYSGTGMGQINTVTSYVGATKVATMDNNWTVAPDSTSIYSILIHEDFPEDFHELLPLYALKCAFGKERSDNAATSHKMVRLTELENIFKDYIEDRTVSRKFQKAWNIEMGM